MNYLKYRSMDMNSKQINSEQEEQEEQQVSLLLLK